MPHQTLRLSYPLEANSIKLSVSRLLLDAYSFAPLTRLTRVGIAGSRMKPSVVKPIGVERNNAKNGVIPCLVCTVRLSFRNEGLTRQRSESLAKKRDPHWKA
jgi:hypothetical protein